ncbi:MAG: DUF4139 domain-containing protein [Bacteroidota bacterium]|nr:DUF4139 domain-containing protein [Bacteroidota bacterium]
MTYGILNVLSSKEKLKTETMKNTALLLMIFLSGNLFAVNEKILKSKIDKVTVFLHGAQVYRSSSVTISSGITNIVFDGLEAGIDAKSIQVSGTGNFIILDVKHNAKYPDQNTRVYSKNEEEIKLLEDSLRSIDYDLEEVANKQEVLNTEKNTLLNNKIIKGNAPNDTLPQLKDALTFLREKMNNINSELLKLKKENYKIMVKRNRIQTSLTELRSIESQVNINQKSTINYQLIVMVSSEGISSAALNLNYTLQNAGWTPSYDLRTNSDNSTMQLTYKANVYQSTGNDWNNVKLTLSTNNPNLGNAKPVLSPFYLNYYTAYNNYQKREYDDKVKSRAEKTMEQAPSLAIQEKLQAPSKSTADYTFIEETILNFEYAIQLSYTIPSDGQTHIVAVQNKEVPAAFEHFAIPKIDNNAFLLARLTGWDDLNLIPGPATVFFDGTYVGGTYIDPANTNDTLDLSMGRDKGIVIKRIKLKDKTKEKIFADQKINTVTYEITLRNTKPGKLMFTLEDQIPLSQNAEIKVELKEASGGKLDENTGKLVWKFNLKPKEIKTITISYEIKYPADKTIANL